MDLNTIEDVLCPADRASLPPVRAGDAILAGGTWLFSEPQTDLRRLIDISRMGWQAIFLGDRGLEIAATCTLAELEAFAAASRLPVSPTIVQSCEALLGSFKIRHVATVGGNLCLALAASPMAALFVALGGVCTIWAADGGERDMQAADFVIGAGSNALRGGEILRSVLIPHQKLRLRTSLRKMSLTESGRSAALLIGADYADAVELTIAASVARPVRLLLPRKLEKDGISACIDAAVPAWYDDVHGAPAWRRQITHYLARDIYAEFAA